MRNARMRRTMNVRIPLLRVLYSQAAWMSAIAPLGMCGSGAVGPHALNVQDLWATPSGRLRLKVVEGHVTGGSATFLAMFARTQI